MNGSWILAIALAFPGAALAQPEEIGLPLVTGRTQTSLTISWTSPANPAAPGVAAAAYDLRYSENNPYDFESFPQWFAAATEASGEPHPSVPASSESMTLSGLSVATPYFIAIKASDGAVWSGISEFTVAYDVTLMPPPERITALALTQISRDTVTLRWPWPAAFPGATWSATSCWVVCTTAGPITDENINDVLADPSLPKQRWLTLSPPGTETTATLTGLELAKHYWIAIRSTNEAQNLNSLVSNNVEATMPTPDKIAPDRIVDLRVTPTSRSTELLRWQATGDDGKIGQAARYELRLSDVDPATDPEWWSHAWRFEPYHAPPVTGPYGTPQRFSINNPDFGVVPGKRLWFAIKAIDAWDNESELSNIVTTDNSSDGVGPTQIQDLQGVEQVVLLPSSSDRSEVVLHLGVKLAWTAPSDVQEDLVLPAARYDIRRSPKDPSEFISIDDWWSDPQTVKLASLLPQAPGSPESTVDPVDGSGVLFYAIRSIGGWGLGSFISPPVRVEIIADGNPPGSIAGLHAIKTLSTSVIMTWTAPVDDSTPDGRAERYQMYCFQGSGPDQWWPGETGVVELPPPGRPGTIESIKMSGLVPGTPYVFMIRAFDRFGNHGEFSSALVQTNPVDGAAPAAIDDLAPSMLQSTYVILEWTATGDDGSAGTASLQDLRLSNVPVSGSDLDAWWEAATPVGSPLPAPGPAGTRESFRIDGLKPGNVFYVAVRAMDDDDKWSPLVAPTAFETEPVDVVAPGAVTTLRVTHSEDGTITLEWSAEGEDGEGSAREVERVDLRYSMEEPGSPSWWSHATPCPGIAPAMPGVVQVATIGDLLVNKTYYFALKSVDEAPNWSELSNVASAVALAEGSSGSTRACSGSGRPGRPLGLVAVLLGIALGCASRERR